MNSGPGNCGLNGTGLDWTGHNCYRIISEPYILNRIIIISINHMNHIMLLLTDWWLTDWLTQDIEEHHDSVWRDQCLVLSTGKLQQHAWFHLTQSQWVSDSVSSEQSLTGLVRLVRLWTLIHQSGQRRFFWRTFLPGSDMIWSIW